MRGWLVNFFHSLGNEIIENVRGGTGGVRNFPIFGVSFGLTAAASSQKPRISTLDPIFVS